MQEEAGRGWLLLVFTLPKDRASERVKVWRHLKQIGAIALNGSGYLLPFSDTHRERLQWVVRSVESAGGEASLASVHDFVHPSPTALRERFSAARGQDYQDLIEQLRRLEQAPRGRGAAGRAKRASQRLEQIREIDFFGHPLAARAEEALHRVDAAVGRRETSVAVGRTEDPSQYRGKVWVTRPRPGIDRVASAWLIRRFIDPEARFVFAESAEAAPDAVAFDMFQGPGFGHRGDDCTFETLRRDFGIEDGGVATLARIVHDADLRDDKFGRVEGRAVESILTGWASGGLGDDEILERGIELIAGLYTGVA